MRAVKIYKWIIFALILILGVTWFWLFFTTTVNNADFIQSFVFTTYLLLILLSTITYGLTLIGRSKINWVALALFLLVATFLTIMESNRESVFAIWDYTLGLFVIQVFYSLYLIIGKKGRFSLVTKAMLASTTAIILSGVVFKPEALFFYSILDLMMICTGALLILHLIIPSKKTIQ